MGQSIGKVALVADFCIFNDDSIPFAHNGAEEICRIFLLTVHDMRKRLGINIVKCKNPDQRLGDIPIIESGNSIFSLTEFLKDRRHGEFKDLWRYFLSLSTTGYLDSDDLDSLFEGSCFDYARETGAPLLCFGNKGQTEGGVRYLASPEHVIEEWKYRCSVMDFSSFSRLFPNLSLADSPIPLNQLSSSVFSRLIKKIFIPLQLFAEYLSSDSSNPSGEFSASFIRNHTGIQNISLESDSVRKDESLKRMRYFRINGISEGSVYFPLHIKENDENAAIRIYLYWGGTEGFSCGRIYFVLTRHLPTKKY